MLYNNRQIPLFDSIRNKNAYSLESLLSEACPHEALRFTFIVLGIIRELTGRGKVVLG